MVNSEIQNCPAKLNVHLKVVYSFFIQSYKCQTSKQAGFYILATKSKIYFKKAKQSPGFINGTVATIQYVYCSKTQPKRCDAWK